MSFQAPPMAGYGYETDRVGITDISAFAAQAKLSLGGLVSYEAAAIEDVVEGLLSGDNIAEGGAPGSAKTLLMNGLVRLVGASEDEIAVVPGVSDLSPSRLIGGESRKRIVEDDGTARTEIIEISGIFTPSTVIGKIDEYPRLGRQAKDALYPIMEERKVRNSSGHDIYFPRLLTVIGTMNRPDARSAVQSSEARRWGVGVLLDAEPDHIQEEKSVAVAGRGDLHRVEIEPITSVEHVKAIQNTVRSNAGRDGRRLVQYPETVRRLAFQYQKRIKATVEDFRNDSESTTGMSAQMARLAIARAMAHEELAISPAIVLKAAQRMMTARIVMLAGPNDNIQQLIEAKNAELSAIG